MIGDVKDQVEEGEEEGEQTLAYLKMPSWKYYTLTMTIYTMCVLGAILVADVAIVFDFVGAFGLSITSFTLPACMYLILQRNEKAFHEVESSKQRKCNHIGSYCALTLSIVNMILVIVKVSVGN